MNVSFTVPNSFRNNLLSKVLDFSTPDTFYMRLTRPSFSFSTTNYNYIKNITATSGAIDYAVVGTDRTMTRSTGSFVTDGFVAGNYITTDGTNVGTYQIRAVTALVLSLNTVGTSTLVDETATSKTITCQDEMAAITSGALTYTVAGTAGTFTRGAGSWITDGFVVGTYFTTTGDVTNDGVYEVTDVAALILTATPVGNSTLVDESAVGKIVTNGYTRANTSVSYTLDGSTLTLDTLSFSWSTFGPALLTTGGCIIYDDTATGDPIVSFLRLSPWDVSF